MLRIKGSVAESNIAIAFPRQWRKAVRWPIIAGIVAICDARAPLRLNARATRDVSNNSECPTNSRCANEREELG